MTTPPITEFPGIIPLFLIGTGLIILHVLAKFNFLASKSRIDASPATQNADHGCVEKKAA